MKLNLKLVVTAGAVVLTSCGTKHSALSYSEISMDDPVKYKDVASCEPMASSFPEVFDNGPQIHRKMLELVESAKDYILVDSFLLSADDETRDVLEALKRKHRAGVRVYILADSSGRYLPGGKEAVEFLEKEGIPYAEYNPMRIYKLVVAPLMLKRDHRKFWIIDGKVLFLGGANLFRTSLEDPKDGGNRDFMVAIECEEAIKSMVDSFVVTWNLSADDCELKEKEFRVRAQVKSETMVWLSDQNRHAGRGSEVARMFEGLFAVAREEMWLIQPYTFVTNDFLKQIRELRSRGVEVNVMLSDEVQSPRFHYASFYGIKNILEVGGKVWVYKAGKGALHAKAIVVDGEWASIGSANLNARSYHLSKEANLVFGDPESVGKVVRTLEDLKKNCRQIEMKEAGEYRSPNYYVAWLLMQLMG